MTVLHDGEGWLKSTASQKYSMDKCFQTKEECVSYVNALLKALDPDVLLQLTMTISQGVFEAYYVLTVIISCSDGTFETMSKKLNVLSSI